ncbi:MAG: hypothetical protein C0412_20580 [Flavobacterium sp.]|nr:hypothetical protein [Flavobacterium sp.]
MKTNLTKPRRIAFGNIQQGRQFIYFCLTVLIALGISISFQSLLAIWTNPTTTPPGGNLFEPINVSSDSQGKLGNLGIGTTTPNKLLHVYKASGDNAEIDIQSVEGINRHWGIYNERSENSLKFWNNDIVGEKNALTILSNGSVGIGTTTPSAKLHIQDGGIKLTNGSYSYTIIASSTSDALEFKNGDGTTIMILDKYGELKVKKVTSWP